MAHRNPCGRGANTEATLHSPEAPRAWGSEALHGRPAQRGARIGPEVGRTWEEVRPENIRRTGAVKQAP